MIKRKLSIFGFTFIICILILSATIAYAALNTTLMFNTGLAVFSPEADIRIVDFKLSSVSGGGYEEYNSSFSIDNINTGIVLPNLDSSVTYEITVTNYVDVKMVLSEIMNIAFNNPDMEYELIDMQINDIILGIETKVFYIKFKYKDSVSKPPQNTSLGVNLDFVFTVYDNIPPKIKDLDKSKEYFITQASGIDLVSLVYATDNVDGDITNRIVISITPEFNKNSPGTYEVTYNVQDTAGNEASPYTIKIVIWNFIKIVNGQYHGLALGSNGSVWTWGWNSNGQRGIGSSTSSASGFRAPTKIDQSFFGNLPVIDIAAGYLSSLALNSEGQAYGWGQGTSYQLGNNSTSNQTSPVPLIQQGGITFTQISSFYQTGAGLGTDGNIYTWGNSLYGSTGTNYNITVPTAITSTGNFIQISQGYYGGVAVSKEGQVYVWGSNVDGQLGSGSTGGYNNPPTLVSRTLSNIRIKSVSYGTNHILALSEEGKVYSWGNGGSGRLCIDSVSTKSEPTLIPNLSNVALINAAYDFSQFKVGNNIYSCGYANYGELFAGNVTTQRTPYLSKMNKVFDNVSYIAGKYDNAYILSLDGTLVHGIGYSDAAGQEFGSTVVQTTSNSAVVPWSFTPPALKN